MWKSKVYDTKHFIWDIFSMVSETFSNWWKNFTRHFFAKDLSKHIRPQSTDWDAKKLSTPSLLNLFPSWSKTNNSSACYHPSKYRIYKWTSLKYTSYIRSLKIKIKIKSAQTVSSFKTKKYAYASVFFDEQVATSSTATKLSSRLDFHKKKWEEESEKKTSSFKNVYRKNWSKVTL